MRILAVYTLLCADEEGKEGMKAPGERTPPPEQAVQLSRVLRAPNR